MTTLGAELRRLIQLSGPVALTQLGMMTTSVVDTVMMSRVGVAELAASGLSGTWQWALLSLGLGLVMGIDPLISQAHGRGDSLSTGLFLQRGLMLALVVSVPLCLAFALTEPIFLALGQEPEIAHLAGLYCLYKLPAIPAFLLYSAVRQWLQGRSLMAPSTWVMWIGNAINVLLNWALIFGHLGSPALGIVGAAIASSLTSVFLLVALIGWVKAFDLQRGAWAGFDKRALLLTGLLRAARLGLPVGLQLSLEATAFAAAAFMAGWLGQTAVGSHQIVITMAALSFMVPLGVAQGAATRVGNLIGRGDEATMRRAVWLAVGLGAAVMVLSALSFALLRFDLPRLFTSDPALILSSALVLPIAAAFQLCDGTQVVAAGVLRGMGRTDAAMIINLLGHYVLALPLGYLLAFHLELGLLGIWIGLAFGLTTVAGALLFWIARTLRRPFSELRVANDEP